MARHTSANFTNFAFTWGDANSDAFVHGDVQLLAQAVEAHDHTSGKGLAPGRLGATTIVGSATLTWPTTTDTMVGRATTDTLTNKTLTSPVIGGTASGAATIPGSMLTSNSVPGDKLILLSGYQPGGAVTVTTTGGTYTVIETLVITPVVTGIVLVLANFVADITQNSGSRLIVQLYNSTDTVNMCTEEIYCDVNTRVSCTLGRFLTGVTAAAKTLQVRASWFSRTNDTAVTVNAGDYNFIQALVFA